MTRRPLVLLTLMSLAGCELVIPQRPSGKNGILDIGGPRNTLAAGLRGTFVVPDSWYEGCGYLDSKCVEHPYDFTDATFEVTSDGLTILSQQLGDSGLDIEVACTADPEVPTELHVRVMAGDTPRYEDGIDVVCREVTRGFPLGSTGAPLLTALGTTVDLRLILESADNVPLDGRGIAFPSSTSPLVPQADYSDSDVGSAHFLLTAAAVGTGTPYTAGLWQDTLPYEVLSDDAWDLSLTTSPGATAGTVYFTTKAVAHSGPDLVALDPFSCTAQITSGTDTVVVANLCTNQVPVSASTGQICVTALRHSTCADFAL